MSSTLSASSAVVSIPAPPRRGVAAIQKGVGRDVDRVSKIFERQTKTRARVEVFRLLDGQQLLKLPSIPVTDFLGAVTLRALHGAGEYRCILKKGTGQVISRVTFEVKS